MRIALAAAATLVLASAASAAPLKTRTAHLGPVEATISWQQIKFFQAKNVRLQIKRNGSTVLDRKLGYSIPQALKIRDLDGNGEAEVIADFYTGGAHCCLFSRIYRYTGTSYVALKHPWGDLSYRLSDLNRDGVLELVSADDHFAYAFTAYAGSAFPVQIWAYVNGKMRDVTRSYPSMIRTDAASLWKAYLREHKLQESDVRGIMAAWMADQYLLGRQAQGWSKLQALNRKGEFRGIGEGDLWAKNGAYLAKLRKFLGNHGYSR